jgi:hypothetical protein
VWKLGVLESGRTGKGAYQNAVFDVLVDVTMKTDLV